LKLYRIIHIPAYRDPYQRSLLLNLKRFNLDIKYGRSYEPFSAINLSLFYNYIKYFRVNLIHLHWQHTFLIGDSRFRTILKSFLFVFQMLVLKLLGVRFVWTIHNLKNHDNKHKDLELFFSSIIARFADAIIAHCNAAKGDIQRVFGVKKKDKIAVIPHGAFLNYFENNVSQKEARNRLNISSKDLTFLFLGLVRPYKGVLELIKSFQKLHDSNAKLIIAGKVPNEQLSELIHKNAARNSNIQLVIGYIPDDEMQIYMNGADILVLPYRDILTSGGVISGMSFGKAIIAPYMGCIPEVLDSSGGFLYHANDKDGLLNAMKRATTVSRSRIQEMGNYNLNVAKQLDWHDVARSTYRVYERCFEGT
jgi:beta-1,4-mannosyltransferase